MELLGTALKFVYQAVLDRRATTLFEHCSKVVSDQLYDGRFFDPATTDDRVIVVEHDSLPSSNR